jgi:hypothetical protein
MSVFRSKKYDSNDDGSNKFGKREIFPKETGMRAKLEVISFTFRN